MWVSVMVVSNGLRSLQIGMQYSHLDENGQQLSGRIRSGGVPLSAYSSCLASLASFGTELSSAQVYGC